MLQMNVLNWTVGEVVRIKLRDGEECEGQILAFDKRIDSLLLSIERNNEKVSRILRISSVLKTTVIKENNSFTRIEKPPPINENAIKEQERLGLKRGAAELAKLGKGVSKEAQSIFDKLSKTYEMSWNGKVIQSKLLDLSISPPYGAEQVVGKDQTSVDHIKQILASIKEK